MKIINRLLNHCMISSVYTCSSIKKVVHEQEGIGIWSQQQQSVDLLLEVTETKPEHQTDVMVEANQLVHQPICYLNMGKNLRHQTLSKPNELGRIQRLGEES